MIKRVKAYFDLSSSEIKAFAILISLVVILIILDFLVPSRIKNQAVSFDLFESEVKQLENLNRTEYSSYNKKESRSSKPSINITKKQFYFDPNSTDSIDWIRLGVSPTVIASINAFILSGNVFRNKAEVASIPGFDKELYRELQGYIFFRRNKYSGKKSQRNSFTVDSSILKHNKYNLNWIDTTNLKKLKGIGSVFANRIVNYRNRMGGFVCFDQLYEIYGMKTEVFNVIYKNTFLDSDYPLHKHAINLENKWQLIRHPYFDSTFVAELLDHRINKGPFKTTSDLMKYGIVSDTVLFNKMKPYLALW